MLEPHPHLYNRAVFRDIATKSGNPGQSRDIRRAKFRDCPGHSGTVGNYALPASCDDPRIESIIGLLNNNYY